MVGSKQSPWEVSNDGNSTTWLFFPERRFVAGFFRRLLAYLTPHISYTYPSHHTYPTHIHSKRIPPIRIRSTRIPPIRIHAMRIHSKGVHQQESQTYPTNTYPTNTYPFNTYPTSTYPFNAVCISRFCYSAGMVMKIETLLFFQFLCNFINWI